MHRRPRCTSHFVTGPLAFLRPELWWVLPAAVALRVLWTLVRRRRFVGITTLAWLAPSRYRASVVRRAPVLCLLGALAAITLALMEPVIPYAEEQVQSRGLDIVLVLDLSSSMQETMGLQRPPRSLANLTFTNRDAALPVRPPGKTRLETTKDALRDFVTHRPGDRLGLVVFSDNAYVVSPLTFDHDYLQQYIDMVDAQILRGEGMTAIGDGIGMANEVLARQSRDTSRVVVVFTDGENNHGRDPVDALGESSAAGTRVHVVGVDLEEEVKTKPQVLALIETVRQYGGRYYNADTVRQLRNAYLDIDKLEKGMLTSTKYTRNAPVFDWFVVPALILLTVALTLRALPFFVDLT